MDKMQKKNQLHASHPLQTRIYSLNMIHYGVTHKYWDHTRSTLHISYWTCKFALIKIEKNPTPVEK